MDVSIIIVNYNTINLTAACIQSVIRYTKDIEYEIILVDNFSKDGSKEYFTTLDEIRYIYNTENIGFGAANNIGAKIAIGKYLFFLNSDTLLIDNSIKHFYQYMEANPSITACGGNLVDENRRNTPIGGKFPSLLSEFSSIGFYKLYKKYHKQNIAICQTVDDLENNDIDYILGADIFIKAHVFHEVCGFDETFFMYYEETDLCKRLSKYGHKLKLLPEISIIHFGGQSTKNEISQTKYKMIYNSKLHYYRKHHSLFYVIMVKICEIMKITIRPYYFKKDYFSLLTIAIRG